MINLGCRAPNVPGPHAYTHSTLRVATLQETIELGDAFATERLCNNQKCETHHCSTTIPVFSLGSEGTILKGLLSAEPIRSGWHLTSVFHDLACWHYQFVPVLWINQASVLCSLASSLQCAVSADEGCIPGEALQDRDVRRNGNDSKAEQDWGRCLEPLLSKAHTSYQLSSQS